jgi:hypothetical protein
LLSLQIYCPNTYDPIINIQGQAYNKQWCHCHPRLIAINHQSLT